MSKKDLALHQDIDQITSSFGKGAIMWLGRTEGHREVPVVSTGSFSLDMALGIGGLPKVCIPNFPKLFCVDCVYSLHNIACNL
jgi:RecA/RadA recombinase